MLRFETPGLRGGTVAGIELEPVAVVRPRAGQVDADRGVVGGQQRVGAVRALDGDPFLGPSPVVRVELQGRAVGRRRRGAVHGQAGAGAPQHDVVPVVGDLPGLGVGPVGPVRLERAAVRPAPHPGIEDGRARDEAGDGVGPVGKVGGMGGGELVGARLGRAVCGEGPGLRGGTVAGIELEPVAVVRPRAGQVDADRGVVGGQQRVGAVRALDGDPFLGPSPVVRVELQGRAVGRRRRGAVHGQAGAGAPQHDVVPVVGDLPGLGVGPVGPVRLERAAVRPAPHPGIEDGRARDEAGDGVGPVGKVGGMGGGELVGASPFILIRFDCDVGIVHIDGTADSINTTITRILPKTVLARVITLIIILCDPMVP